MNKFIKNIFQAIGWLSSFLIHIQVGKAWNGLLTQLYTGWIKRHFNEWGEGSVLRFHAEILTGLKNISVGKNTIIGENIQLTAWEQTPNQNLKPTICIGNNCNIRKGAHISAVGHIRIGNGVLTGTNVLINDNSHGETVLEQLNLAPERRPLCYKGPINIGDNVWLGNNVCVLGGVTIGDGVIIGANAVVTKDIPSYSIAAGIPAKVIRKLTNF